MDLLQASALDTFAPGTPGKTDVLVPALNACILLYLDTQDITHLEKAIEYAGAALDGMTPEGDPAYEDVFLILSDAYFIRATTSKSMPDIDKALHLLLHRPGAWQYETVRKGQLFWDTGTTYMASYDPTGYISDLDSAISFFAPAIEMLPSTDTEYQRALKNLEEAYWLRFLRRGNFDDWDAAGRCYMRAVALDSDIHDTTAGAVAGDGDHDALVAELIRQIELQFQAVAADPELLIGQQRLAKRLRDFLMEALPLHPKFLRYAAEFGRVCVRLPQRSGYSAPILDMGITQLVTAIRTGDERDHNIISCLESLADCYRSRHNLTNDPSDLDSAIEHLGAARDKVAQFGLPLKNEMLHDLSQLYRIRYVVGSQRRDFDMALQLGRAACTGEHGDSAKATARAMHLAFLCEEKARIENSLQCMYDAMGRLVEAYDLLPHTSNNRSAVAHAVVVSLVWIAEKTSRVEDLEEALRWGRKLLPNISKQDPAIFPYLEMIDELRVRLRERSTELVGVGPDDTMSEQALELSDEYAAPRDMMSRQRQLEALVVTRVDEYLQHGDSSSLEQAIGVQRETMSATSIKHVKGHQMGIMAELQLLKFDLTGDPANLDQAFHGFKSALTLVSAVSDSRVRALMGLATTHSYRHARDGAMEDLDYAIKLGEEAQKSHCEDNSLRRNCSYMLAALYDFRYRREQNPKDIVKSLDLYQQTQASMPADHPGFSNMLKNYAIARYDQYAASGDGTHLDKAIQDMRDTTRLFPATLWGRPVLLENLAILYLQRFGLSGRTEDLQECIKLNTEALQLAPDHDQMDASVNLQLGISYAYRSELESGSTSTETLRQAQDFFEKSAASPTALPLDRFAAYRNLVCIRMFLGNPEAAADLVPQVASLIPQLAPQSLDIPDKQHIVAELSSSAQRMAAALLMAGKQLYRVLEVLESGRGIIMSSLGAVRAPMSELLKRDRHLAEDYLKCRRAFDQSVGYAKQSLPSVNFTSRSPPGVDHRYKASAELERTMTAIRKLESFERFLLPPTEGDFRQSASSGPIAVLNVDDFRSDALVIQTTGLSVVSLPDLHLEDIRRFEANLSPSAMTMALLEWLWDVVADPVLRHLGFDAAPAPNMPWPHMRWVVTGRLAKFPIHAAGYHEQDGRSVLDRVVSSYSFSLSSLVQSLKSAPRNSSKGPDATAKRSITLLRAGQLDFVPREIARLERLWTGNQVHKPNSCSSEALECLKDCDIFHFAGHGYTHPTDPQKSALVLDQDRLTLSSLLNIDLQSRKPFLAYLSACGTSRIRRNELLDEGLHLVSALQVCGFRHVIGTLWDVDDEASVDVSADTYSWMQSHGMNDQSVSEGLHHAVRKLRAECCYPPIDPPSGGSTRTHTRTPATGQMERVPDLKNQQDQKLLDEGDGRDDDDDVAALGGRLRALGLETLASSDWGFRGYADVKAGETPGTLRQDGRRGVTTDYDEVPFHWVPYVHFGV